MSHIFTLGAGVCIGVGLAFYFFGTRNRTSSGIAGLCYVAAGLLGGLAFISEVGWK